MTVCLLEEVTCSDEEENNTLSGAPVADTRQCWKTLRPLVSSTSSSDPIHLLVSVEDTGVGIPLEAQSRVFTPFMQVGPSISRIHGGTGIGLSICKCLVGLMKGEIGFVSEPNRGSTFFFTAVLDRRSDSEEFRSPEFQGLKALVVDPRPVRAKVTRYQLRRLGIHVDIVPDLKEAKKKVPVDMMLVDREEWVRSAVLELGSSVKIFVLANPWNSPKVTSSEAAAVIVKPLRASMLAVTLRQFMGNGGKESQRTWRSTYPSLSGLLGGKTILVVDDNVVNLRVAAGALNKYGAEVTCVDSGKKAISLLQPPHQFDACFMDIQMPEMDG